MKKELKNQEHKSDFNYIVKLISETHNTVFKTINKELVLMNWEIGKYVSTKVNSGAWGDGIVVQLSEFIKSQHSNLKGFNKRALYRMKQFYETYKNIEKINTYLAQLSWTNNLLILSKCKTIEEKQFYIFLAVKEKWSKRELQRQIESSVFERTMLANKKVSPLATQLQNKVNQIFKDTYVFEFLDLPINYKEICRNYI